ncbi:proline-rich nuclear receptor coactivator 2 B-like [Culicoides brevitarsis]|uniref:proline-rich nuclear receptor coactivator 2 B-like n=1 Tax=Culicoides brevitarsis TaxID=469753 RepID=UPI00307B44B5
MTNSHNKINNNQYRGSPKGASPTDRFFNNNSPPYLSNNGRQKSSNNNRQQRSPSTKYFSSQPSSNICITPNKYQQRSNNKTSSNRSPASPAVLVLGSSPFSSGTAAGSPPNFSHFASSKCYDAPLPTSLPKPPTHWTSCSQEAHKQGAKKFDIFSHNLKSILNVQA